MISLKDALWVMEDETLAVWLEHVEHFLIDHCLIPDPDDLKQASTCAQVGEIRDTLEAEMQTRFSTEGPDDTQVKQRTRFDPRETVSQFRIPLRHVQEFLAGRDHDHVVMPYYAIAYLHAYTTSGADTAVDVARERIASGTEYDEGDSRRGYRFLGSLVKKRFLNEIKPSNFRQFTITDLSKALLVYRFPKEE